MDNTARATAIGVLAPMLWGMSVGITRGITENFGVAEGLVALYALVSAVLLLIFGRPRLRLFSWKYLVFGIGSANLSAVCFVFSLAFSDGGHQTMEVGMVNYLWPCLTILFGILFNGQKAHWWIVFGIAKCLIGVVTVLGGNQGFDPANFWHNIQKNPLSYGLALCGAITWSAYSSFTRALANGQNPVVLIFLGDLIIFSLIWLSGWGPTPVENPHGYGWLGVAMGAFATGAGYSCWTYGMMKGNMTLLAIASYFTPVLSCLFGTVWIGANLTMSFWNGVMILVAGSLVCWLSTRVGNPIQIARPGRVLFKGSSPSATKNHQTPKS